MALAAIGNLPPTIMDRSIVVPIRRKTNQEQVNRLANNAFSRGKYVRAEMLKWSIDKEQDIQNNMIEPPDLGNSRVIDNWLPLFTLANQVSDRWLKKCEAAHILLNSAPPEPDISTLLLSDIRDIFTSQKAVKITSADLVGALVKPKDKPWCEIKNGGPMSQNGLAVMLRKYNIRPSTIRLNGSASHRGYEVTQFQDTFDRYLPSTP